MENTIAKNKPKINSLSRLLTPDTVYIDITPRCNLRCQHCYSSKNGLYKKEKSYAEICDLLKELSKAHIFKVHLVGREPLIRKDFSKILSFAYERKFSVRIATNGTLITPDIAKVLAEYKNINSVQISIDSLSPKKHNEFRGNSQALQLAIRGIELLIKNNIKVCIATTLTNFNYRELKNIADFTHKIGAYYYRTRLLIGNPLNKKFQVSKDQYRYAVQNLFDIKDYYNDMTVEQLHHSFLFDKLVEYNPDKEITVPCGAGISRCSITYDFKITPCIALAHLFSSPLKEGFSDEWQKNNVFHKWLKIFTKIKGKCRICGYRYKCGGGCRANVFGATNNIFSSDPWCWFRPDK